MELIKQWVHGWKLATGFAIYLICRKTPPFAYQSMIRLFCLTKGRSNDVISRIVSFFNPPIVFPNSKGALGNMADNKQLDMVVSSLKEQGYYVFPSRLADEVCDRLLAYAMTNTCSMRPMDGNQSGKPVNAIYHRGNPQSVRYEFKTQDLLRNQDVQKLLGDFSFAAVAQDYLGARPALDVMGLWWHTAFSDKPDMEAAQYFHFDMDRPKWLKFFIYLTDVETANGPHSFVAGSHKTQGIPPNLLKKGYARLTDEEVGSVYDAKNIIEFAAPRGTIIAEDTRGLHKGKHVASGDRLVLQLQFSNSLFGCYYPKVVMGSDLCDELKNAIKQTPEVYSAYL